MTTQVFPTNATRTVTTTFTTAQTQLMDINRGKAAITKTDNTVASLVTAANPQGTGTVAPLSRAAGVTLSAAGVVESGATIGAALFFITNPIKAGFTMSGAITCNIRAFESAAAANYAVGCKIYKVSAANAVSAAVAQGSNTTELGTSEAAVSISLTPTSTAFAEGDAIGALIFFCSPSGSTSASGRTASVVYNGPTAAASGDTFFTFNETFSFLPLRTRLEQVQQAVTRSAVFCLGEKWARHEGGKLWVPSRDREFVLA